MSQEIRRSDWFIGDLEHYAAWYQSQASWDAAERYLREAAASMAMLAGTPGLGRRARFASPVLRDLRFYPLGRPFAKHLIFYRYDEQAISAERIIHGARDLRRRLTQPPAAEGS